MSAFVVSKAHIDSIVQAAKTCNAGYRRGSLTFRGQTVDTTTGNALGRELWQENVASVLYLYPHDTMDTMPGPRGMDHESILSYHCPVFATKPFLAVAALKALDCYEYQSCEHPGWETSEAREFVERMRGCLIGMLPGYDDAPWEIVAETRVAA